MPRGKAKRRGGRRGRPTLISTISTTELQHELQRREGMLGEMMQRHAELQEAMSMLESEIGAFGPVAGVRRGPGRPRGVRKVGRPVGGGSGRPRGPRTKNSMSLPDFLVKVLTGTTMGVSEAAEAVKKAGYKTKSPNFRTMVNQALLANTDRFKKVARGQYTAK